jgi:hypothetical protein
MMLISDDDIELRRGELAQPSTPSSARHAWFRILASAKTRSCLIIGESSQSNRSIQPYRCVPR